MEVRHREAGTRFEHAMIEAAGHWVQVSESEDGNLELYVHDHLNVEVRGDHKDTPLVVVDSDEFQTHLELKDTEGSWTTFRDGRSQNTESDERQ